MQHTEFINVRTGQTIEVIEDGEKIVKVVTVTSTGARINPRDMKTTSLHRTYLNRRGAPYASGFVPVAELPDDHPLAPQKTQTEEASLEITATVDFDEMDDDALSAYAHQMKTRAAFYDSLHEEAKTEMKTRKPDPRTYVHGNTAIVVTTNLRFDAKKAKAVLTSQEYAAILKPKPDASLAKEILSEKRYAQVCTDHGNKMEIRSATDEDRQKVAEYDRVASVKAEIDADSMEMADGFYPKGAVAPF